MQRGRRSAEWDHTALLLLTIRRALGDKTVSWERLHPFAKEFQSQSEKRKQFREFNDRFRKKQ